jgi:hypothetical protein
MDALRKSKRESIMALPESIDLTKISTRRLLVFKKKHYPYKYACCCEREIYCQEYTTDTEPCGHLTSCQEYWADYKSIKKELSDREHVEK